VGNIRLSGESRSYDVATGRMTMRAGGSYSYDRAGNLVSWTPSGGSTWTYSYDPLDRLVAVRQGGTVVARYGYDVLGRRIVKRVYGGANAGYLRMIYAGDAVAAEADSGGTLTLGYTWGIGTDDLVAVHRYSDGGHWYVVQDQLRSVRGLTRRDGTWVASWRYRIYGAVLDSLGAAPFALRYRWTGREYDAETGWYYFRARYYEPGSQRFVQEDPLGYAGGATLYGYAGGNPVVGRDPSGLTATPQYPDAQRCLDPAGTCGGTGAYDPFGGGGGGGMDWNGDGWDDGDEFAEYSFGLQLWRESGGRPGSWSKVWWGMTHNDPQVRAFILNEAHFGRVLPLTLAKVMSEAAKDNLIDFFGFVAMTNAAPGQAPWYHAWQPALTVYINDTGVLDHTWTFGFAPNTIAHEASHLYRAHRGRLGSPDQPGGRCGSEETWASQDAWAATGIWQRNRCR